MGDRVVQYRLLGPLKVRTGEGQLALGGYLALGERQFLPGAGGTDLPQWFGTHELLVGITPRVIGIKTVPEPGLGPSRGKAGRA